MRNFPGEVINMAVEDGGLGIRSLSDEANERKLGLLTKGIGKDDQAGFAFKGMIGRRLREAGMGGMEDTESVMGDSLGACSWITSVLQWLKKTKLSIKVNGKQKNAELAMEAGSKKSERIAMNKRGIVLKAEGDGGDMGMLIPIRVG